MKRIIAAAITLSLLLTSACTGHDKEETEKTEIISDKNIPEADQVVFVSDYIDCAWGYCWEQTYVTGNGQVYRANIGQLVFDIPEGMDKYDYLFSLLKEYEEPNGETIDPPDDVISFYNNALELGNDLTDYKEYGVGCDMPDKRLFFKDPSTGEYIMFDTFGNSIAETNNEDLLELRDIANGLVDQNITEIPTVYPVNSHTFGYRTLENTLVPYGNYLFEDASTFYSTAEEWGIDVSGFDINEDSCVFARVGSGGPDEGDTSMMCFMREGDGSFRFCLPEGDNEYIIFTMYWGFDDLLAEDNTSLDSWMIVRSDS